MWISNAISGVSATTQQSTEKEMAFVMDGFYAGKISEDEIKGFFLEYAHAMQARNESKILNLYESFLNVSYERAVKACFDEGKDIAEKEGIDTNKAIYYDADYYYQAEEIHEFLKEITEEYAAKYGVEIDIDKRESGCYYSQRISHLLRDDAPMKYRCQHIAPSSDRTILNGRYVLLFTDCEAGCE